MLSACETSSVRTVDLPGVRPGLEVPLPAEREPAPTDRVAVLGSDGEQELGVPDFVGRYLVVNFWASWCAPCRTEQPALNAVYERLGDEVAFLGVDLQDSVANGLGHVREFDVPYPSVFDRSNRYAAQYEGVGPRSIPSTIIIDPEGRVAVRLFGETWEEELTTLLTFLRTEDRATD